MSKAAFAGRLALGLACAVLLVSYGGAVLAAPVTLPLLWWAGRGASRYARTLLTTLAMLTAAEAAWAVVYLALDETTPLIWAAPVLAAVAVAVGYPVSQRRSRRGSGGRVVATAA